MVSQKVVWVPDSHPQSGSWVDGQMWRRFQNLDEIKMGDLLVWDFTQKPELFLSNVMAVWPWTGLEFRVDYFVRQEEALLPQLFLPELLTFFFKDKVWYFLPEAPVLFFCSQWELMLPWVFSFFNKGYRDFIFVYEGQAESLELEKFPVPPLFIGAQFFKMPSSHLVLQEANSALMVLWDLPQSEQVKNQLGYLNYIYPEGAVLSLNPAWDEWFVGQAEMAQIPFMKSVDFWNHWKRYFHEVVFQAK